MTKIEVANYTRISKTAARKAYYQGTPIYIVPCYLRPDNMYMPAVEIGPWGEDVSGFDNRVNAFEYYNCNHETGYYTAFYLRDETL